MRIITALAALLLGVTVAAGPVAAQPIGPGEPPVITLPKETEKALRKGADELLRALKDALNLFPRFEAPRVDEDGNLVIPAPRWPELPPPVPGAQDDEAIDI